MSTSVLIAVDMCEMNDNVRRNKENERKLPQLIQIISRHLLRGIVERYGKKRDWSSIDSSPDLNQVYFKYSRSG